MVAVRQNLHLHTTYSDGRFSPDEIVAAAVAGNLAAIGISDHFFTTKVFRGETLPGFLRTRWPRYLVGLETLQKRHDKTITVWRGMELDTCLSRVQCDLADLPWEEINRGLDYLLVEYVGETSHGGLPLDRLPELRDRCRIPLILAHPDLEAMTRECPIERLAQVLQENRIALELPGGSRNPWFWHRRNPQILCKLFVTIGTDVHRTLGDVAAIEKPLRFLEDHGLLGRLADPRSLWDNQSLAGNRPPPAKNLAQTDDHGVCSDNARNSHDGGKP